MDYGKAKTRKLAEKFSVTEIPFEYDQDVVTINKNKEKPDFKKVSKDNFKIKSGFMLYKDLTGKMQGMIIKLVPDENYSKKSKDIESVIDLPKDFSGVQMYFDVNENSRSVAYYKNGKIVDGSLGLDSEDSKKKGGE